MYQKYGNLSPYFLQQINRNRIHRGIFLSQILRFNQMDILIPVKKEIPCSTKKNEVSKRFYGSIEIEVETVLRSTNNKPFREQEFTGATLTSLPFLATFPFP
jgi:hypothetical protein